MAKAKKTPITPTPADAPATVFFVLKNGQKRVFSEEGHGPDYHKVATEFLATNHDQVAEHNLAK